MYGFNTRAWPAAAETGGQWLAASDAKTIAAVLKGVRESVPEDGTSLINAFGVIGSMTPAPDQIILITDGLPTQGVASPAVDKYIGVRGRERLFEEALKRVPNRIPVDVVLFPMKGDNPAAHRFWQLALSTGGSYLVPSRDWP